jgi:hypothetical protein
MTQNATPSLKIHINGWSLLDEADPATEAGLRTHLSAIKNAGFQSYCWSPDNPKLKELLKEYRLRFGGAFDAVKAEQFAPAIAAIMAIDNGPINCQLADEDTPMEEAIELTLTLMAEAKKQNAPVHLEVHRDTCTETPEKTAAIMAGYKAVTGEDPLMNFDFSHPAVVKHILAKDYLSRLLTPEIVAIFQKSTLWHIRPFNAQHCQVPITDGNRNFSPEYLACRPFVRQALKHWLEGPRPTNELWVMPELGTTHEYKLSCFPNIWGDTLALGQDIQKIWAEELAVLSLRKSKI